jgi:site-specific recombinase XerC
MATTSSASLVLAEPVFSDQERLALAGFLAGYSGMTRETYALDLRQFTAWCHNRQLRLFAVRRADIELFARELEAAGRARATVTRRLSTIAGLYNTPSRRTCSTTPQRSTAAARGSTTSRTPSAWNATRSALSSWPPGSAPPPSTP